MPLDKSEIDDIIRSVEKMLFTHAVLIADYLNEIQFNKWIELDEPFREDMLENFEETLYQRLGLQ